MPRFSVIVPAYKVQAQLHACLRSVLEQSYPDLELLAVDDCSPDSCGAIIEEFAARDARVVPVHLPRNAGSGPARNAGLARADGDYVVLLDGDDSLTPGALEAIAVRLKETEEPDLLLYGHAYALWTGEEAPDPFAAGLATARGPAPSFTLDDRPDLLELPPLAWNKAYRRDFLEREILLFPPGGHGDPAWTYPVLLTAKTITTLERVCVHRRLGRGDAALTAGSHPGPTAPDRPGGGRLRAPRPDAARPGGDWADGDWPGGDWPGAGRSRAGGSETAGPGTAGTGRPGPGGFDVVRPNAGSLGVAGPGTGSLGVVRPDTAGLGIAGPDTGSLGIAGPDTAGLGIVRPDTGSLGIAGPDTGSLGIAGPDTASLGIAGPDTASLGIAGPDTASLGIVRPDTAGLGVAGAPDPRVGFPGTGGARPFDVFAQYDRVFARLADRPDLARWRPVLFRRMVDHLTALFDGGGRHLPRGARAEFLRRARAHCRRHRVRGRGLRRTTNGSLPGSGAHRGAGARAGGRPLPGGGQVPDAGALSGVRPSPGARPSPGVRLRRLLVRLGWHRAYRLLSFVSRQGCRGRCVAGRLGRGLGEVLGRLHYRVQRLLPVRADRAVFASHGGHAYGCNPAALEAAFRELAPRIRTAWIAHPEHRHTVPPGTQGVRPGSLAYWTALARSRYLVGNAPFDARLRKRPGQVVVQTQAGTPLKRMGLDVRDRPAVLREGELERLLHDADRWDYVLSGNRHSTLVWERAFPAAFTILEYGLPRTDRFHRADTTDPAHTARLRASLGIPEDAVAVLYAPTYRDYRRTPYRPLDLERLLRRLGPRFVLLARAHPAYGEPLVRVPDVPGLIDVSDHPSVESLCLASDVLLTDYSSLMFDYAGLDRPVVIHAEDREAYEAARGTYFDLRTFPPGPVVRGEEEIVDVFLSGRWGGRHASLLRAAFRERFCPYDDGGAAERVVRHVVFGERGLAAGPVTGAPS
ncbi:MULTISPECIES: bifunctional glycosyltransferase family 2 protein/CDP-glycerol:glycerophosphate glycerophosphotransferase [unclassified Streptomyces]|uniref:bifunctional glycosyltransferase family 2 protein/CDP-glycerol:glycerophosphate glycerophosphotransferase n=1 Tax=unclassified Streptomyces TaxID=2593676 RepID=UPI000B0F7EFC|nr:MULTISPECIES: bifunctional glycosyltransferase family 2 protein/CDP-glycerol:glycerophosphate glycerophosphotransferase [unclassified Streptomyces]